MEWTEIDPETKIEAIDFADGVLVRDPVRLGMAFCQGWQVLDRGDMDGPGLRRRKEHQKEFAIRLVEAK